MVAAESSGSTTAAAGDRSLAFVLGPGRSGTSTMAGALFHSGYHVPKAIKGNETNPVGFFEPRWVVNFHRRLAPVGRPAATRQDPEAMRRLEGVLGDQKIRDELHDWLARRLERHGRLVIKDPRMVWFRDLWVDAAHEARRRPRFVIMLRHPSEVSSSRSQFYNSDRGGRRRRLDQRRPDDREADRRLASRPGALPAAHRRLAHRAHRGCGTISA